MAVKALWSREEAIILLDALIQTLDGKIDRNTAVSAVSEELRKRAKDNGQDIDDVFRNTNGISLQMRSMEYLFTDGLHGLNKPVRVFQEVVDLYKHDRPQYNELLKRVKGMSTRKNVEEQFAQWFSTKVSPRQLSELYMTFPDVESFCLDRKILKKRLFETTDRATVKVVVDTVNSSKVFRFKYKKNISKICSAMKYYYDFIKELTASEQSSISNSSREDSTNVTIPTIDGRHDSEENNVAEQKTDLVVDFASAEKLSFTKPSSVTYFDDSVAAGNWTQAYIQSVAFLLEDYPETFKGLINHNITGQGRSDFADENGAKQMTAAKKVADNFFIETNLSATDIVAKIRHILDLCNVDYENLVIRYTRKDADSKVSDEHRTVQNDPKPTMDTDGSEERVKFIEWMKNAGIATATILSYLSAINQCAKALKDYGITEDELLTIKDTDALVRYRDELLTKTEFKKINEQQHNRFRSAFNKLIDYRSAGKPIKLAVTPQAPKSIKKEIPKIAIPDFSASGSTAADPEYERFDAILRENFSEGLLPNALRLDKFRMLYEDEYGTEPTQDDELLVLKLKKAGSFIDGRIYPKQDTQQNNLLAEMLTEIINTLNDGARCVYLSCVMERWQQELANQLSVYNEDTLRSLLISQKVPGLFITDNVLKATAQKVYPEENIISVMKESHYGMTYQQIQEKLWFIPLDEIKHTLVTTPQIVNVESETYFYAPNFPASPAELQHLKMCMKSELAVKGYLVAQDIANIIHDQCHTIAINTADYKNWAYRNILKYIFRDDFQFSSAVISEKGKAIELWQVFRNYCRDHERITLDDLNTLKNELGVPIYWDTVLTEMVRVNADELVRRDLIHFDIDATDKVLDEMCLGDYMALKDISLFLHFPPIEYPWNEFVLESYLQVSKVFKLYHVSYANHGAFGVMVRSSSRFEDYRAVVVDMLAHSKEWNTPKQALELIVDKGYQARKRWTNFEQVTQEASLIREKLEAERM